MNLNVLFSLVLFAAAIVPGFIFVKVAERRVPRPERSQLLEAAEVVFVSVFTTSVAALAVLAFSNERDFLDKRRLTGDFGTYLLDEPVEVFGAFVGLLLLSVLLAFGIAQVRYLRVRPSISQGTMWWEALGRWKKTHYAYATVERTDGWIFAGQVLAYSMEPEIENRELVLRKPIHANVPMVRRAACRRTTSSFVQSTPLTYQCDTGRSRLGSRRNAASYSESVDGDSARAAPFVF
jgi:hypothetical protein